MERQKVMRIVEEALLQYGFIILPVESVGAFIDYLRSINLLHFFRISKSERYAIVELNTLPCEYECNSQCHNHNGYRDENCYISCLYGCREERLHALISKIKSLY